MVTCIGSWCTSILSSHRHTYESQPPFPTPFFVSVSIFPVFSFYFFSYRIHPRLIQGLFNLHTAFLSFHTSSSYICTYTFHLSLSLYNLSIFPDYLGLVLRPGFFQLLIDRHLYYIHDASPIPPPLEETLNGQDVQIEYYYLYCSTDIGV